MTENAPEIAANATPGIPNIIVQVKDNNTVMHGGKHHEAGDEFEVEGPTAIAMVQGGHVDIVGSATPKKKKAASKR